MFSFDPQTNEQSLKSTQHSSIKNERFFIKHNDEVKMS